MIFRRILKVTAEKAFRAILNRAGFWADGMYDFSANKDQGELSPSAADGLAKWLVVIGRNGYFETTKDYPIGHFGDVKKALKNEAWRFPYQGARFDRIERLTDRSHRVTSWVVKQDVLDGLKRRPLWIVPESVCYEVFAQKSLIALERLNDTIYVAKSVDGLVSSMGNEEAFLQRVSALVDQDASGGIFERLSGSVAVESILLGLIHSLRAFPLRFFIGLDAGIFNGKSFFGALKLSVAILGAYLITSSAYLMVSNNLFDYRLAALSPRAEKSIEIRRDIASLESNVNNLNAVISDVYPMWIAWDILMDLEKRGVSFRAVNSSPPVVTFYLTASRATDVLSWLDEDVRVSKVKFAVPVRKIKGLEEFALEVTVREDFSDKRLEVLGGV